MACDAANTALAGLKPIDVVIVNANDTVTFVGGANPHAVSESSITLGVAYVWSQSESSIVGNGGGSSATLNPGTPIMVNLQVNDGRPNAPSCPVPPVKPTT